MLREYYHKTKVVFGNGAVSKLGEEAAAFGKKAMILCDQGVIKAGILGKATAALKGSNIDFIVFDEIKPNPRDEDCDRAAEIAKEAGVDLFIGLGGGSAMDTAKAVAMLMTNEGPCKKWDGVFLEEEMMPVICIPTTAGTGSEVTFVAVITDPVREYKMTIFDPEKLAPKVAIADPELTLTLPPSLTASTGVDALTHAIEAYTCKVSQPLTDAFALHGIKLIRENIVTAVREPGNLEARANMMIASLMAGVAFINANVGAVHAISETIGGIYDTPHGVGNSIFLPFVMEYNLSADLQRFSDISAAFGIDKGSMTTEAHAKASVDYVKELNRTVAIPTLKDLGYIKPENFDAIAERSASNPLSDDNGRDIDKEGYIQILNKAYEI